MMDFKELMGMFMEHKDEFYTKELAEQKKRIAERQIKEAVIKENLK